MDWVIMVAITTVTAIFIVQAMKDSNSFNNNDLQLLLLRHNLLVTELQEAEHSLQQGIIEEKTYQEIHNACSEEIVKLTKKIEKFDNNCNGRS